MKKVIGIDLGTTNSLVAVVEKGVPKIVKDADGNRMLPSVLAYLDNGEMVVGNQARELKSERPYSVVSSVKRLMGKGLKDLSDEDRQSFPFDFSASEEKGVLKFQFAEHTVTPPELSARILMELKKIAAEALNEDISDAVITVPAYFDDTQRQATKDAGKLAGLNVLRIVNEPTAASLAYGLQRETTGKTLVFDLGGGTFDVSILELEDGIFEVLATKGDTHLGGDDFDFRIVRYFQKEIEKEYPGFFEGKDETFFLLRKVAEQAKIYLSEHEVAPVQIEFSHYDVSWSGEITRETFENICADLVDRSFEAVKSALKDADLMAEEIDNIVLVGGSSRIPLVRQRIKDYFQKPISHRVNPDEVVALGAALQADILANENKDLLLLDVVPLSLGMETFGGIFDRLILRNRRIPCSETQTFTNFVDGQNSININVYQGERELVRDCKHLASFKLGPLEALPAGTHRIDVSFIVDANGIMNVSAVDQRSGLSKSISVKPSYGLGDTDVKDIVRDSFLNAEADFRERMLADARREAEQVMQATQSALDDHSELISNPEEREDIEESLRELKEAHANSDFRLIMALTENLSHATNNLAQEIVNEATASALKDKNVLELED